MENEYGNFIVRNWWIHWIKQELLVDSHFVLINHEHNLLKSKIENYAKDIIINNCEAQARVRQGSGWPLRRKASKLKPKLKAYIKVGCHLHTHPPPKV